MKYQAHIKYIDGTLITVIWDNDYNRFIEEVELARKDIAAYLGKNDMDNANLFIMEV